MPGAQDPSAGFAGYANFISALAGHNDEQVRVNSAAEFGFITDEYALIIQDFTGSTNEFHKFVAGKWYIARSRTNPMDFMATTPDGVHGYAARATAASTAEVIVPPMMGLGAGEHNHIGTATHSHSFSAGDPQGGSVGGETSVASPDIYAQHEEQHYHRLVTPPYFAPPQPGDMVVVLWVQKQIPFVVDVVANTRLYMSSIMAGQWEALGF
jgi:hypothetical protein